MRTAFFTGAERGAELAGSVGCGTLTAEATAIAGDSLTDPCCLELRAFAAGGCACSSDVSDLLTGMKILPAGVAAGPAVSGIVALVQASRCSNPALGGPIVDGCTGSVGCPVGTA